MLKEFKTFVLRGNVLDLAVAVIIGAAFGKIVGSAVADIIMPPIGLVLGGVDFSSLALVLKEGATPDETVTMNYGKFIQTVVDFSIIAFVIFMVVKGVNNQKKKEEAAPAAAPELSNEEKLLTEIRDILKTKN
jgi:large conductance mechanosensitive channel